MNNIAVIMSTYKNDKLIYIQEALNSLYQQTLSADIFIVMDGQLDISTEQFLYIELKNKKIKYLLKQHKNRGLAYSLNELLAITKQYEFIARMDSDDISVSNRLETQYNFMKNNPKIDVIGSDIEEFGDDIEYSKIVKYPTTHSKMCKFFEKRVPLAHVSAFFRQTFWEKAGVYKTHTISNEDTILWMDGFNNGCKFGNIPKILVRVRVSKSFFSRRGGVIKAYSDFRDRVKVIRTLKYPFSSYIFAIALFVINISPSFIKKTLYEYAR